VKVSRHSTAFASVALVLATACSACGSSPPSAPSVTTLRQQFLAVITRTNAALARDTNAHDPSATDFKYSVDFGQAASGIHALTFPTSMHHDATTLVSILDTMAKLAKQVGTAAAKNQNIKSNVIAMAQINLKLIEAEKTEKVDSDALRHELGLPAETTTTVPAATTVPPAVLNPPKG
jgi:hypothetical protein